MFDFISDRILCVFQVLLKFVYFSGDNYFSNSLGLLN